MSACRTLVVFALHGILALAYVAATLSAQEPPKVKVLFLGDGGSHRPRERAAQLIPALARRNIELTYTEQLGDLNAETLGRYDALLIYGNMTRIEPDQEKALLAYVAGGRGLVALHSASYCFLNSDKYIELVGAQFQRHGGEVFHTEIAEPDHPIMRGFGGFESWDETYVHHRHNEQDRLVLSYRVGGMQADGRQKEPWTWVRTHGKGRVFYTAWGHDERTWRHPGFQNLVERGIRWAAGGDPGVVADYRDETLAARQAPVSGTEPRPDDLPPLRYVDIGAKIPNYPAGSSWGTQDRPLSEMQLPLAPEDSRRRFVVPAGFELRLFAAEPDLEAKPIAIAWDERGRLWVAETFDYPNELQPPGKGRDRIRICEDTDGDGRADRFTVFAEGLSIPATLTFHRGGVIVQDGVQTVYLKDSDGDQRADVREVMFTGWNMGDTHGGVSNFQYGLDNWIWAMQGYNHSEPVVRGQKQQAFRMGFFRFKPDGSELEFVRSTNNNTWGLGISEEGIIFGSTANRNPSVYMPIANRYYERVRGWAPQQLGTIADTHLFKPVTNRVRQVDQHGGYTAGAGHAIYTARTYPQAFWNRTAFVCGPTGHLVGTFVLARDGADFKSTSPANLVASDDEWTAPIMAEVGPDGNVWIVDWYNFIVQHNPTPRGFQTGRGNAYETDLRDRKHGRIYRLVYKGSPAAEPYTLADATPQKLVDTLKHPTMLWRKHAQRLLVERGQRDVVPTLVALVEDRGVDAIGLNVGAIHALWTLDGLGALDGSHQQARQAAVAALGHPSAGVRRNAVQVLPRDCSSVAAILDANLLHDADAQVRLAALLALADMPADARAGSALADLMLRSNVLADRWLGDALTSAAAMHAVELLKPLAEAEGLNLEGRPRAVVTTVAQHLARGNPSAEQVSELLAALRSAAPPLVEAVVSGLAAGWPAGHRVAISAEAERVVVARMADVSVGTQGELIRLAPLWGSKSLEQFAARIAEMQLKNIADESLPAARRIEAAEQLVNFVPNDGKIAEAIVAAITPQAAPELAVGLVQALAGSTADQVGVVLVDSMPKWTPATRAAAIRVLLARPETTGALLRGIDQGAIPLGDLSLDQKQALADHPNSEIRKAAREVLARGGALADPDRQKVLDEWLPLVERTGNAALGKMAFTKHCAKCHTHGGEGQQVGPDLTGMAVHSKPELLVQILDPSRSVEGNFRVYSVVTLDGVVISGMLAGESRTAIEIIDTEAKRHVVQRDDIDQLLASNKSLMPEGFEKQVTQEELADLLEFLTARGRFTPIPLEKHATIVSTKGMFNSEQAAIERLIFPDWSPKVFEGVPFRLVDPQGERVPNVVMLHGTNGSIPPRMPRQVTLPCNQAAKAFHFLSGVSGWGWPASSAGSVSMIVRLKYADGRSEDHPLVNGEHFADYIRRVDVPKSKFAFALRGQQVRYFAVHPQRAEIIKEIELIKGNDVTSPVVMAITVEAPGEPADADGAKRAAD